MMSFIIISDKGVGNQTRHKSFKSEFTINTIKYTGPSPPPSWEIGSLWIVKYGVFPI